MLGARIAALRRDAGWSQAELGKRLRVSASAVGMYEQGRREPSADTLVALSEIFGVTTDYLLTGDEPNKNAAIDNVDDDLREYLDELRSRPETRLLFSVTKNATKSQIEAIVKMIEEMQSNT